MYFQEITTQGNQPNFSEIARRHKFALNNYLKFNSFSDADPDLSPAKPLAKPKTVKHMTTVQTVLNMTIYITTILCCEDDETYAG